MPEDILAWAVDSMGDGLVFTTGLGPGGVLLLAMALELGHRPRALFLDTRFHFPETLDYLQEIEELLDLSIERVTPQGFGPTWREDRLACCDHRKVLPLRRAVAGATGWINARRRDQGGARSDLAVVERQPGGILKVHPLCFATREEVLDGLAARGLPVHPLLERGYGSVGCEPCTRPLRPGESERDGRVFGRGHTECGIHTRLFTGEAGSS